MSSASTSKRKVSRTRFLIRISLLFVIIALAADAQSPPRQQMSAKTSIAAIRLYQKTLGKISGAARICKFTPTCSNYGILAFEKYGFLKGSAKTAGRILRCSPFTNQSGQDYP
jgi:putative membrane protein insertion efficiency factor